MYVSFVSKIVNFLGRFQTGYHTHGNKNRTKYVLLKYVIREQTEMFKIRDRKSFQSICLLRLAFKKNKIILNLIYFVIILGFASLLLVGLTKTCTGFHHLMLSENFKTS